jgi:hypothetical protein
LRRPAKKNYRYRAAAAMAIKNIYRTATAMDISDINYNKATSNKINVVYVY